MTDRIARTFLGVASLELAFFWCSGVWQIVAYLLGVILLFTAAIRFCPLYRIFGIKTIQPKEKRLGKVSLAISWVLIIAVLVGGSFASNFFTRKLFLEDFNAMNESYKQTLFLTGKNEREKAIAKYDSLLPAYRGFQEKYSAYHPYTLKNDGQFNSDLARVSEMILGVNDLVRTGDLHQAHLSLEKIRPVFQDIFKRNGFSMLAVALVDFHDAMELMIAAAGDKDQNKLIALYPQVSDKLKAVEAEANDAEIQAIRTNLDELLGLAKDASNDKLVTKGEELKSSFIKVYLKRG